MYKSSPQKFQNTYKIPLENQQISVAINIFPSLHRSVHFAGMHVVVDKTQIVINYAIFVVLYCILTNPFSANNAFQVNEST